MQAARLYGECDIRIDDVETPSPGDDEVLIDVAACGICGSDLHVYGGPSAYSGSALPHTLGHEVSGTVVETGEGADVAVGTDVALNPLVPCGECWCCAEAKYNICRNLTVIGAQVPGGYAERVVAPAQNVVPIPDGVSTEAAAVAEPIAVGLHAVRQSRIEPGDTVAVIGAGPIGLGVVLSAKAAGAGRIFVSQTQDTRRAVAGDCGADVLIDPRETDPVSRIRSETTAGVDVAFEAVGKGETLNQALKAAKPGGRATITGVFSGAVDIDPMDIVHEERSVSAAAAYQTGPLADREFGTVLDRFASGAIDPEILVSSRVDLEEIGDGGFEALLGDEREEVKVLVRP